MLVKGATVRRVDDNVVYMSAGDVVNGEPVAAVHLSYG